MASRPEDTIVSEKLSDGRGVIQQLDGSPRLGRFGVVSRAPASTTVSFVILEYVVPMHLIALGFIYAHDFIIMITDRPAGMVRENNKKQAWYISRNGTEQFYGAFKV